MKDILEEKENFKQERLQKIENIKVKRARKQVFDNFDDTSVLVKKNPNIIQQKPKLRKNTKVNYHNSDEEEEKSDVEVNEDICIICGEFGKNRELWLRCVICSGWAHSECTNNEKGKHYVCDYCQ